MCSRTRDEHNRGWKTDIYLRGTDLSDRALLPVGFHGSRILASAHGHQLVKGVLLALMYFNAGTDLVEAEFHQMNTLGSRSEPGAR
jgi:hypothetical protein